MSITDLPALNAMLNGIAAVLLVLGWRLVRSGRIGQHKVVMLTAVAVSACFLVSYLIYHFNVRHVPYPPEVAGRTAYRVFLLVHVILALANVPLVIVTLVRALKGQIERHKPIARKTLCVWLYVSGSGVLIYFWLYHWAGARPVVSA